MYGIAMAVEALHLLNQETRKKGIYYEILYSSGKDQVLLSPHVSKEKLFFTIPPEGFFSCGIVDCPMTKGEIEKKIWEVCGHV